MVRLFFPTSTHLIAFTVVFKTSWSFAITSFAVTSIWFSLLSFPYLGLKSFWISVKACLSKQIKYQVMLNHSRLNLNSAKGINFLHKILELNKKTGEIVNFCQLNEIRNNNLYCFLPFIFMFQVIITISTIAVVAKFTICKAITVSGI